MQYWYWRRGIMTTDIYLVCTLLVGGRGLCRYWAFASSPTMDKRRQEDLTLLQHIWINDKLPTFVRQIFEGSFLDDFSSRKFFNLGNKPIMNDDEVGEKFEELPHWGAGWLIDLKLFHKLGFPPAEGSSFTPISNLSRFTPFWLLSQKVMFTWNKMKKAKVICDKNGM